MEAMVEMVVETEAITEVMEAEISEETVVVSLCSLPQVHLLTRTR